MKGVKFGNYHSYNDFALILQGKTIETPEAKTEYVDISGADGVLDLTEFFGDIKYKNRKLTFEFATKLRTQQFYELFEEVSNALNGKRMNIVLDENDYFYFVGRLQVNSYKSYEKLGTIVIEADCEPYKYEQIEMAKEYVLTGVETEAVLVNLKRRVAPTMTISNIVEGSNVEITFENTTYKISSNGTFTLPELILKEGNNLIKLKGNATISFKYRRGKL